LQTKVIVALKVSYYYGVKVHILGLKRSGTLPLPEYIDLIPASNPDLSAFRQITPYIKDSEIYADKAYAPVLSEKDLTKCRNIILLLRRKRVKKMGLFLNNYFQLLLVVYVNLLNLFSTGFNKKITFRLLLKFVHPKG